ncbi:hypothetical protein TREES_T100001754 [Tupaia chinensis]|uniref:Uncharacterized protein n=1 Tax=Tupaia chinensis TaxID=246437 RepID=L9KJU2_TUPCH|nr:hypothetical protein TREES_T100001754 [Tupaia chinensis]
MHITPGADPPVVLLVKASQSFVSDWTDEEKRTWVWGGIAVTAVSRYRSGQSCAVMATLFLVANYTLTDVHAPKLETNMTQRMDLSVRVACFSRLAAKHPTGQPWLSTHLGKTSFLNNRDTRLKRGTFYQAMAKWNLSLSFGSIDSLNPFQLSE